MTTRKDEPICRAADDESEKPGISRRTQLNFSIDLLGLVLLLCLIGTGLIIHQVLPPGSGGRGGGRASLLWGMDRHGWGDLHLWLAVFFVVILFLHVFLHWSWACGVSRRLFRRAATPSGNLSLAVRRMYGLGFFLLVSFLVCGFVWWSDSSVITSDKRTAPVVLSDSSKVPSARQMVITQPANDPTEGAVSNEDRPEQKARQERRPVGRGQGGPGLGKGMGKGPGKGLGKGRHSHPEDHGRESIRGYMTLQEVSTLSGVPVDKIKSSLGLPVSVSGNERLGRLKRMYGFEMDDLRKLVDEKKGVKQH